ncbi:MAG: hypothetical protein WCS42_04905 [Verrucomicrobiota bacterium]
MKLTQESATRPSPQVLIDEMEHRNLAQFLQKLIPILVEQNLIGPFLKASLVTSISRTHKTRLGQSFRALELAEMIAEYDPLVIDGYEIRANICIDSNTGRRTGGIQFFWTGNPINSIGSNHIKSPQEIKLVESGWEKRERRWNGLKTEQMTLEEAKLVFVEDTPLLEHLRSLMPKFNDKLPKPIDKVKENGI